MIINTTINIFKHLSVKKITCILLLFYFLLMPISYFLFLIASTSVENLSNFKPIFYGFSYIYYAIIFLFSLRLVFTTHSYFKILSLIHLIIVSISIFNFPGLLFALGFIIAARIDCLLLNNCLPHLS